MLADVIFPRVLSIYLVSAFAPWLVFLALAAEFYVYFCYQRGVISVIRLLFIVLGVNVCSWLFGIFLAAAIPDKWVPQLPGAGDLLSFAWACFLSTVIEYLVLVGFRKRFGFRRLGQCVIVANAAGYIVMWIVLKTAGAA
jgi:hypothetical protein